MIKKKINLHNIAKKKLGEKVGKRLAAVIMTYCHSLESLASCNELVLHTYLYDKFGRRGTLRPKIHAACVWACEELLRAKEREKTRKKNRNAKSKQR